MSLEEKTSLEIEPYSAGIEVYSRMNTPLKKISETVGKTYVVASLLLKNRKYQRKLGTVVKEMQTDKGKVVYAVRFGNESDSVTFGSITLRGINTPYVNVPGYILSKKEEGNSTVYRVLPIPEKDRPDIEELIRERESEIGDKNFVNFWDRD